MPRTAASKATKAERFAKKYPHEFSVTPRGDLFCRWCQQVVTHDRLSSVAKHRSTTKHKPRKNDAIQHQQFFPTISTLSTKQDFTKRLVHAFLSADIPLHKLENDNLRQLFSSIGQTVPSVPTCRSYLPSLAEEDTQRIHSILSGEPFFVVIDESEIRSAKYVNVLVGRLSDPSTTYLVKCTRITENCNHRTVIHIIDDLVKELNANRLHFMLFHTDVALHTLPLINR